MTVAELRRTMSAAEYLEWGRFLAWRDREQRWQQQRASAAARRRAGQPAASKGAGRSPSAPGTGGR